MARVDAVLGQHRRERGDVAERRAFAELDPHPGAELGERVLARGRLMARVDPGRDVGLEPVVALPGEAPVARHRQAALQGRGDLRVHVLVTGDHAGHVHHLPQARHALPAECLSDLRGPERGAGVLEARQRGHTRRHGQEDLQRQAATLLEEPAHPFEAEDVRHLVVVDEDRGRPAGQDGLGEARDGDHHRLDVQVGVDQARNEVRALGVDRLGLRADRVRAIAEHRHAALGHRDLDPVEHLAGVDVDEPAVADDEVGRPAAHADRAQLARDLRERAAGHEGDAIRAAQHQPRELT